MDQGTPLQPRRGQCASGKADTAQPTALTNGFRTHGCLSIRQRRPAVGASACDWFAPVPLMWTLARRLCRTWAVPAIQWIRQHARSPAKRPTGTRTPRFARSQRVLDSAYPNGRHVPSEPTTPPSTCGGRAEVEACPHLSITRRTAPPSPVPGLHRNCGSARARRPCAIH